MREPCRERLGEAGIPWAAAEMSEGACIGTAWGCWAGAAVAGLVGPGAGAGPMCPYNPQAPCHGAMP